MAISSTIFRTLSGVAVAAAIGLPAMAFAQDLQFDLPPEEDVPYEDLQTQDSFEDVPFEEAPTEVPLERIQNPVAEFAGIDKITGRIIDFDVYVDETVQFGALQVTPRICYSSGDGQESRTDAFVEVDEITLDRKIRRIFSGWMFAESPGLNAVEHAVYDVWLKACKQQSDVPAPEAASDEQ